MATYGALGFDAASRLTKLYTQHKAATPPVSVDDAPEILSLHRKFRIQKDRLIAWGLEWSDGSDTSSTKGNIDESLQRAGLTELVSSVMENIKLVLDEVDQIRTETIVSPLPLPDKVAPLKGKKTTPWTKQEREQYEDLVKDLTTAMDLLCDLSWSRRTPQNSFVKPEKSGYGHPFDSPDAYDQAPLSPDLGRARLGIPKISINTLIISEESPPSYDDLGAPHSSRIFGHLRHPLVLGKRENLQDQNTPQPVLIEYATFDKIYQENNIPLPISRLQQLYHVLHSRIAKTEAALPKLIAYFEDIQQPRYGLVFELPPEVASSLPAMSRLYNTMVPNSLLDLLQNSSRLHSNPATSASMVIPPMEERYRLAHQLVSSLSFLHDQSFTHKDISSSGVLLLPKPQKLSVEPSTLQNDFRKPLLCSFDLFSEFSIDPDPSYAQQNIYRHPEDPKAKGTANFEDHAAKYDLYSLGLVLLEIGLWLPLADTFKEKYTLADFKTRIERIWVKKLAGRCGSLYQRVVQECLATASQSSSSHDSVRQTYAKIKLWLARCCLLDDADLADAPTLFAPEDRSQKHDHSLPQLTSELQDNKSDVILAPESFKPNILWSKDLPEHISDYWENELADRMWDIVVKALGNSRESIDILLNYVGDSEATARLTLMVMCKTTQAVQEALSQHPGLFRNDLDVVVCKDQIVMSRLPADNSSPTKRSTGPNTRALSPYHQPWPVCGASIGAWRDNEHLGPVTFGGVIMVDGNPFGMSVHHMLEADEASTQTSSNVARSSTSQDNITGLPHYDDLTSHAASLTLGQEEGDISGILQDSGSVILITQPALEDVDENFFPNNEDKDEDHLCSHSFGQVHASSGIRRTVHQGRAHEMDWVLFKIRSTRFQASNVIAGGKLYCPNPVTNKEDPTSNPTIPISDQISRRRYVPSQDLYPYTITPASSLANLPVHAVGRTSGLSAGNIGPAIRRARFPGRAKPSWTWCVTGGIGVAGDSGAWIVENEKGGVCGHVLAWNASAQLAYFSPMEVVLEDIRRVLKARRVWLPGGESVAFKTGKVIGQMEIEAEGDRKSESMEGVEMGGSKRSSFVQRQEQQRSQTHPNLLAHHMLISGNPGHLEREWAARRSALGQSARG